MNCYRSITVTTTFGTRVFNQVYMANDNGVLRIYSQDTVVSRVGAQIFEATAPWEVSFA